MEYHFRNFIVFPFYRVNDSKMNLFDNISLFDHHPAKQYLRDWIELYDTEYMLTTVINLINRVELERKHSIIYPKREDVFKAFTLSYKKVKVVIIGQDPYHTKDTATGLAFASNTGITPSLEVIFEAIDDSLPDMTPVEGREDLVYLHEQGVLLLNTSLTVNARQKGKSHSKIGWRDFIKDVIVRLCKYDPNIVWLLWGDEAKTLSHFINGNILSGAHPAFFARKGIPWTTTCFERCNDILHANKEQPIYWKIDWKHTGIKTLSLDQIVSDDTWIKKIKKHDDYGKHDPDDDLPF